MPSGRPGRRDLLAVRRRPEPPNARFALRVDRLRCSQTGQSVKPMNEVVDVRATWVTTRLRSVPHLRPILGVFDDKYYFVTPHGTRYNLTRQDTRSADPWEKVVYAYLVGLAAGVDFADRSNRDFGDEDDCRG